jgi:hypothetical protein
MNAGAPLGAMPAKVSEIERAMVCDVTDPRGFRA